MAGDLGISSRRSLDIEGDVLGDRRINRWLCKEI
jgi:hypothetical protein